MKLTKKNKQLLIVGALAAGGLYWLSRKRQPTTTITLPLPTGNYVRGGFTA